MPAKIADALIGLALLGVPLAFTPVVREYSFAKSTLLMLLVGAAGIFSAFARPRRPLPRAVAAALFGLAACAAGLTLLDPTADSAAAAAYLVGSALLVFLVATRAATWQPHKLSLCLGLPLVVCLVWSLLQAAGVGLLDATEATFGTHHGVLVGTIGNPNANGWYLLLATALLTGCIPPKRWAFVTLGIVAMLVVLIVVLNRSRAALLAIPLAAAWLAWPRLPPRKRMWMAGGLIAVAGVGVVLVASWSGSRALAGRLYLARITAGMVLDRVALPAGPGAFARDFPGAQADHLAAHPEDVAYTSSIDHAHFDLFEILYELGLPGLALLVLVVLLAVRTRVRAPPGAGATVVAGLFLGLSGYPLFSPAPALVLLVASGLWLGTPADDAPRTPLPTWAQNVTLTVLGAGLLVLSLFRFTGELRLVRALELADIGQLAAARGQAESAVRAWPSADALFYRGNLELASDLPAEARRSYQDSFRARPRPETAGNLALACELLGAEDAAEGWRRTARRLEPGGG